MFIMNIKLGDFLSMKVIKNSIYLIGAQNILNIPI